MLDFSALNLNVEDPRVEDMEVPKATFGREKLLEEVNKKLRAVGDKEKKGISLVIVGEQRSLFTHR